MNRRTNETLQYLQKLPFMCLSKAVVLQLPGTMMRRIQ